MTRVTISDRAEAINALQNESYAIATDQLNLAREMQRLMERQYILAQRQGCIGEAINKLLGVFYGQE